MKKLVFLLIPFFVLSCGDDNKGGNAVPAGSKPGWTPAAIEKLQCEPKNSKFCDCLIPKVTTKYTPEEVMNPNAVVASDIVSMANQCKAQNEGTSQPPVQPGPVEPPPTPVALSYEFSEANCTTGFHQLGNLAEYCEVIQSDVANKSCALEFRKMAFKQQCPGEFVQKP